ncbi:MAG TPA: uroporphyrinogen decarboxylase family protein [Candidatus Latescibacteria bacterium]|jgi:uroporphyrinogen decarboxylase|nr:uroporphyrinogen decarboxylase family protein [Candidatus Latescibacterota bacterium]HQK21465.1 uroporphyrinogen decarboxylase family protein [Candidatus Latescibacterota bacterium]HRS94584.1 uroporphyrinogen decarboxylase family protein [Candidatus Latescibacterota bacterium]
MATDRELFSPLPREEVIKAVERRKPARIPLVMAKWWGEGLGDQYGDRLREFDRIPDDVGMLWWGPLDVGKMGLSWQAKSGAAHDSHCVIDDWNHLDEFIEKMPDPERDDAFSGLLEHAERMRKDDRYILFGWWGLFFERPWGLRGMENLMADYYEAPEHVHRLHSALADLYIGYIRRAAREFQPDGFWTSDDLGHQTQSMMRREQFDALLKPYYDRVGKACKEAGMHWWLHSCGNNTVLLPSLIDAGVDVFHPVQKHTMDEIAVAREFGGKITFLAGIDVQHTLQEKTPEGVREEVRFLIDTFDQPDGGMCIASGNGIVSGTPFENIEAFLDESVRYGAAHRRRFA